MKPEMDVRFGKALIQSRSGLSCEADLLFKENSFFSLEGQSIAGLKETEGMDEIPMDEHLGLSCLLVDEAQFLSQQLIEELLALTIVADIPVIAYGLKTDYQNKLFEGSKALLELSDSIEEIKTTCFYCERKATGNLKLVNDKPVFSGDQIELGADEMYRPCCKTCRFGFTMGD